MRAADPKSAARGVVISSRWGAFDPLALKSGGQIKPRKHLTPFLNDYKKAG